MDLESVSAVLKGVVVFCGGGGQLPWLADRNESSVETIGKRRPKNEAARFHSQHQIDFFSQILFGKRINQRSKADLVLEQSGDVIKQNALLGEIRHLADQLLEVFAIAIRSYRCALRHHHAPSMRNVFRPATGLASDSSTSSTRAALGPCLSRELRPSN